MERKLAEKYRELGVGELCKVSLLFWQKSENVKHISTGLFVKYVAPYHRDTSPASFYFLFWNKVSLVYSGWPWTHSKAQAVPELFTIPLQPSK